MQAYSHNEIILFRWWILCDSGLQSDVCNGSGDAWHYTTPHCRRCNLVQCITIKNNRSL